MNGTDFSEPAGAGLEKEIHDGVIDVVVPVYRGLDETSRCIESVLAHPQKVPHELIVIDDASPDAELVSWLERMAAAGRFTLLHNAENRGFVATVNRGMALHAGRDVVLLNSDTEVANDWLDRLHACARADERTGTATPFSNNATICSYPRLCEDNPLPEGYSVAALDHLFRETNRGRTTDLPTAVGFCMYIRRACLRAVGPFNVEHFGKGYGEENYFCLRASALGWRHVLCADTYVHHKGGVSFSSAEATRKAQAMETLRTLHPAYESLIGEHIRSDPARPLRLAVDARRILRDVRPRLLFVTHNWGGGVEKHVAELADLISGSACVLTLRPDKAGRLVLSWQKKNEVFDLVFRPDEDHPLLLEMLREFDVQRIHYHHIVALPERVMNMPRDLGDLPYDFTIHDYYLACPRIHLATLLQEYCGEPVAEDCNRCLRLSPAAAHTDIETWRARNSRLLNHADRVFAPNHDVARRIRRYFPAARVIVAPHPDMLTDDVRSPPAPKSLGREASLRIAVLGALSPVKGADLLEQCAIDAVQRALPLEFHLIGDAYRRLAQNPESRLTMHGAYGQAELPSLLARAAPHVAWFPARWPETYSYTLSECLREGLPIAAPDLGAFPERVAGRAWTWICPWKWNAQQWNDFFVSIRARHFITGVGPAVVPGTTTAVKFDYRTHYLGNALRPASGSAGGKLADIIAAVGTRARL